ncbi:MAG: Vi polysaccharide biosynthesis protein VipA/TviB [Idiomarina sp.]|nr:Vi polysaccharide biosynthesis protein VipA/TviB [Idiomarina sp.]
MKELKVCIVGLGYVGLPLCLEFAKKYHTVGYDINSKRVHELNNNIDRTLESDPDLLEKSTAEFTTELSVVKECNFYIVTVPTPIDSNRQPDLYPLISASEMISKVLKPNDYVVYESTVYPGATEEVCVPILEKKSGLKFNKDFFVGYSPERINPGDKERSVTSILKVTSGSTKESAIFIDKVYKEIIHAGTHLAPTIKVAEAAKVIENTQRDVNIALINELYIIFSHLGIDTKAVLDAAGTKWNFIKLNPGLVGGHCISVDPYYLMHKSMSVGYVPDIIRVSRQINDGMPKYVAQNIIKELIRIKAFRSDLRIGILGFAFKPNCPDFRNTKVYDLYIELLSYGIEVEIHDTLVESDGVSEEYGITLIPFNELANFDVYIKAVEHEVFSSEEYVQLTKDRNCFSIF